MVVAMVLGDQDLAAINRATKISQILVIPAKKI